MPTAVDLGAVPESGLHRLETLTNMSRAPPGRVRKTDACAGRLTDGRPSDTGGMPIAEPNIVFQKCLFAPLLVVLLLFTPACAELELLAGGSGGGPGPPPSGSLSVSFIDVGQGDGVLVQAGGESYLIDAGRPEEGPNVVDFLRSRGVDNLDGIVVSNPDADHIGGFLDVFDAFPVETVFVSGDPNSTLTYSTFLRGVRDEGATTEVLRTGMLMDWGGVRADA
jgi:beta-lactamase superfamily II metal-dependent hydrolase